MPVSEIDRQLDTMLGVEVNEAIPEEDEAEWTPPMPSFWYQEHERVADAFFGPTAETLTGTEALSRRIQVINDLVALCELRQPSGREQRTDWSRFEEDIDLDGADSATVESTDDTASGGSLHTADLIFPADQCMFCTFDKTLRHVPSFERNSAPTRSAATWRTNTSTVFHRRTLSRVLTRFATTPASLPF
jgi:hypothetical protein